LNIDDTNGILYFYNSPIQGKKALIEVSITKKSVIRNTVVQPPKNSYQLMGIIFF